MEYISYYRTGHGLAERKFKAENDDNAIWVSRQFASCSTADFPKLWVYRANEEDPFYMEYC